MQSGNLIGPVIVAIGVVIGAIAFAVVGTFLQTADTATELRLNHMDETLQAEVQSREALAADLAALKSDLSALRDSVSLLANQVASAPAPAASAAPATQGGTAQDQGAGTKTDAITEQLRIAKLRYNKGITQPGNKVMLELLGRPREAFNTDCQPITNEKLKSLLETRQVGPLRVAMLKPALDSLQRIFDRLQKDEPDIYAAIGTAGTVCARFIRGSTTGISNHSWGTAIDVTLEGKLDPFADGGTQFGLLLLADAFNDEGWFWGAGYDREDSMHFEVGEETLRKWAAEGKL
jgi:hypothetical protein